MTEIVIPAQPKPQKKGSGKLKIKTKEYVEEYKEPAKQLGLQGIKLFIAIIVLVGFLSYNFLNVGRIVKAHLTVFPITSGTAYDHESVRWLSSDYSIAKMAFFLNENTAPEDKVFVFRQSDLAFYTKNEIAVFTDNAYSHLYEISDMHEFRAALETYDIQYVARPPYGMAEINNSNFSTFLASPEYSRLVFEDSGYQIFKILKTTPEIKITTVRDVDLSKPEEMAKWFATRMPMSLMQNLRTKLSDVSQKTNPASITLSRNKASMVRKELIDVLQPWDIRVGDSPSLIGATDFEVTNGTYVFSSNIEAEGVVNLYIDLDNQTAGEGKVSKRKLLWSGVVNNKRKTIAGQTLIMFDPSHVIQFEEDGSINDGAENTKTAKLFFSLAQGGHLTVYDLNFKRLEYSGAERTSEYEKHFSLLLRSYQDGWRFGVFDYANRDESSAGYTKPLNIFGMRKDGTVIARQTSSAPISFTSPTFLLPSIYSEEGTVFKVSLTNDNIKPVMHADFLHSGHGSLSTQLIGKCLTGGTFSVSLPSASLRQTPRALKESTVLPCLPVSARFVFTVKRDIYRIPPNFSFGNIALSNLSLSIQTWQNEQKLTKIDYFKSTNIEAVNLQSALPQLPINGDF